MLRAALSDISIIIASFDARDHLARSLEELARSGHEVIVVDNASTDGSAELVGAHFPSVKLVRLDVNRGYGAAENAGVRVASGRLLLLMNADAWPLEEGIERLADVLERRPDVAVVGPRLLNPDGSLQRSVRGFPTLWRLATEYLFLRWLAPWSRLANAFYGAGFDHESERDAEFLVGAVLLARRDAFEGVGGFDEAFFMFNEEVDLCYRLRQAGWRTVFTPEAEFVHVGGASTRQAWDSMYPEQLRSHLRFAAKHHGRRAAERTRRLLLWAMRLRALVLVGERSRLSRRAAAWLASGDVARLLAGNA